MTEFKDGSTGCGPACVVNAGQIIHRIKKHSWIPNLLDDANDLNELRTEKGTSFVQVAKMFETFADKYFPELQIQQGFLQLDLPEVAGTNSLKTNEISIDSLRSLHAHAIDFVQIVSIWQGQARLSHMMLILGRDAKTGYLVVIDPMVGRTYLFSDSTVLFNGKKTVSLKIAQEYDPSNYYSPYLRSDHLAVVGVMSVTVH